MNLGVAKRYELEAEEKPPGLIVPKPYAYIRFKAFSFLDMGPAEYRAADAFGYPHEDTPDDLLSLLRSGCKQIMNWAGITEDHPLEGLGVSGFYCLLQLFHFGHVRHRSFGAGNGTFIDHMEMQHVMTGELMTLFNKVGAE